MSIRLTVLLRPLSDKQPPLVIIRRKSQVCGSCEESDSLCTNVIPVLPTPSLWHEHRILDHFICTACVASSLQLIPSSLEPNAIVLSCELSPRRWMSCVRNRSELSLIQALGGQCTCFYLLIYLLYQSPASAAENPHHACPVPPIDERSWGTTSKQPSLPHHIAPSCQNINI